MSYPDELIEKVAAAIRGAYAADAAGGHAALDALGLREERVWLEGSRRYVTEWEDAE